MTKPTGRPPGRRPGPPDATKARVAFRLARDVVDRLKALAPRYGSQAAALEAAIRALPDRPAEG